MRTEAVRRRGSYRNQRHRVALRSRKIGVGITSRTAAQAVPSLVEVNFEPDRNIILLCNLVCISRRVAQFGREIRAARMFAFNDNDAEQLCDGEVEGAEKLVGMI